MCLLQKFESWVSGTLHMFFYRISVLVIKFQAHPGNLFNLQYTWNVPINTIGSFPIELVYVIVINITHDSDFTNKNHSGFCLGGNMYVCVCGDGG